MKIHSVFYSLEGEGILLGSPTIFIRFQGCSQECVNCDTKETWNPNVGKEMSIEEIVKEVQKYPNINRISITGGNPLEQNPHELINLIKALKLKKYFNINLELPGVNDSATFVQPLSELLKNNFVSLDIKTPSTGKWEESKKCFIEDYFCGFVLQQEYPFNGQIKMVVSYGRDLEAVKEIVDIICLHQKINQSHFRVPIVLTPCWNTHEKEIDVKWIESIRDFVFNEPIFKNIDIRIICQQHKMIWGAEKRDV